MKKTYENSERRRFAAKLLYDNLKKDDRKDFFTVAKTVIKLLFITFLFPAFIYVINICFNFAEARFTVPFCFLAWVSAYLVVRKIRYKPLINNLIPLQKAKIKQIDELLNP